MQSPHFARYCGLRTDIDERDANVVEHHLIVGGERHLFEDDRHGRVGVRRYVAPVERVDPRPERSGTGAQHQLRPAIP